MQTTEKQSKESGKVQLSLLVAVVLAAGSAGVWSELRAASPSNIVSRGIIADSADGNTGGQIFEHGDGTAFVQLFSLVGDTQVLSEFWFALSTYTISTQLTPGQSGNSNGSGTGQITIDPAYTFDINTFEQFGPFVATANLAVANASDLGGGAFVQQGVTATIDPQTGQTIIVRQHIIGQQAIGATAGSITVRLDGNVVGQGTGGFGLVQANTTHTVQRIR